MVFNYRKIASPSTGTIYIGLRYLHHEEKQTLPVKLQNVFNSFKLSRFSLLLHAKSWKAFSGSVTIYQNKLFVFAVALTDTQAQIPLKHCFHQAPTYIPCLHCVKVIQFYKLYMCSVPVAVKQM